MDIKAIKNKKYFKKSNEIYKNIMISSARARQIIDSRYQELVIEEDIESSDQLEELIEDQDFNLPKAIVLAAEEFMNEELDWRIPESESSDEAWFI